MGAPRTATHAVPLSEEYQTEVRSRIERIAQEMAEKSATSLMIRAEDEQAAAIERYVPTSPESDEPFGENRDAFDGIETADMDEEEGFEVVAGAARPITARYDKAEKVLRETVMGRKSAPKVNGSITLHHDDALHGYNMSAVYNDADEGVIPIPKKSEIKTLDLRVRGVWEQNPNANEEVQLAARIPIVNNQIRTIIEHLITSRPTIQGPPELVEPIRRWFEVELELQTGHERGLDRFVTDVTKQLLYYGSCALVKQRTRSGLVDPFMDPSRLVNQDPVWGYAVPDMATMEVFVDTRGRVRKWRQKPFLFDDGKAKEYRDRDVFLARLPTQNSSLYFWTPSYVMPALYAVQVLRDLHQLIEAHTQSIVDYRYYVKVGSKDYHDGKVVRTQIEKVGHTINTTARGGTPIFPWFVDIEKIDLDEYVEQLQKAASFWEQEIRRGVGGSMLQDGVGDSSTRNTSDALTEKEMRAAQALVPELQRAFRWLVADKLWEFGIDPKQIKRASDWPSLQFEEIDMAQQVRRETHYLALWQNDGMKHAEFRKSIGRDEDPDRAEKYWSDIQADIAATQIQQETEGQLQVTELAGKQAVAAAAAKPVTKPATKTSTAKSAESSKKAVQSQTRPGGQPRPAR